MIAVSGLVKRYGSFTAVKDVSFEAGRGEILGLLGPNGAGKTTILRALTGYHAANAGEVVIGGFSITEEPLQVKQILGYLPEQSPLYTELNVYEYLQFICEARAVPGNRRKDAIDRAVVSCNLQDVVKSAIGTLSKGFRQRVGLAQAIIHDPQVLILDEPVSGLDPNQILEIRALIQSLGKEKTVILSSHVMQEIEALCSRVLILNQGRVVAEGTAEEIAGRMHGNDSFRLEIAGAAAQQLEGLIPRIPGYVAHAFLQHHGHSVGFTVTVVRSEEAAGGIFDWAVQHKLRLVQLQPERLRMEEIFTELTSTVNPLKHSSQGADT
ncbi:MAG: ABC transporter ATP-binding protein [Spirochaeta sp.]